MLQAHDCLLGKHILCTFFGTSISRRAVCFLWRWHSLPVCGKIWSISIEIRPFRQELYKQIVTDMSKAEIGTVEDIEMFASTESNDAFIDLTRHKLLVSFIGIWVPRCAVHLAWHEHQYDV